MSKIETICSTTKFLSFHRYWINDPTHFQELAQICGCRWYAKSGLNSKLETAWRQILFSKLLSSTYINGGNERRQIIIPGSFTALHCYVADRKDHALVEIFASLKLYIDVLASIEPHSDIQYAISGILGMHHILQSGIVIHLVLIIPAEPIIIAWVHTTLDLCLWIALLTSKRGRAVNRDIFSLLIG